ncbi:MAG: Outer-membrane-phospholipid-binding lipoprotein MlaA [Nitrospira sp.]|nr:MAG: Outer-membrane-phospholipid-binding lipoprotein MlaA [Nitrospira sp.]
MVWQGASATADQDRGNPPERRVRLWVLSGVMAMIVAGCGTAPGHLAPVESAVMYASSRSMSSLESDGASLPAGAVALSDQESDRDEYDDPFAERDETMPMEENDPWEPFNAVMFEFNRKVDKYALKPVAQAYNVVLPDAVQVGIDNFFHHVRFVPRFMNNLLQAKVTGAGIEMGRFFINSTLGIGGFFDPAKHWWDLSTPDEDAGQTLGVYGVKPGPYLVLPFLPPLSLRDGIGYVMDLALDPINWLVFPIIEVNHIPSIVAHKNRATSTIAQFGTRVGMITNDRSLNLEKFQGVEEATLDLYAAVRSAYWQKRTRAVRE